MRPACYSERAFELCVVPASVSCNDLLRKYLSGNTKAMQLNANSRYSAKYVTFRLNSRTFFSIMNRKPTLWVFLMLFAFTGQLLAAPFLDCPQLGAMAAEELGVDCLFMDMAAGTQQMADAESQRDGLNHSDSAMTDCYLCLHCPAGVSPMQVSAVLSVVQGQSLAPDAFIPPSHLDGLFRPPISA